MNCPKCKANLKEHSVQNITIEYCTECWNHIGFEERNCDNHNPVLVKYPQKNNTIHLKKQCASCGKIEPKYYPRENFKNWENLPFADFRHKNLHENIDYDKIQDIFRRYEKKKKEVRKNTEFNKFLEEHNKYLKTADWKKRRVLVLNRDNYLCQSCLEKSATQVHHKSYRYWKNEPLFELVSVCDQCHDIITDMNREVVNFSKILNLD